jgi:hypothetical protein
MFKMKRDSRYCATLSRTSLLLGAVAVSINAASDGQRFRPGLKYWRQQMTIYR